MGVAWTLALIVALSADGSDGAGAGGIDVVQGYATMDAAPGLGSTAFTIEAWFRRDGPGVPVDTGYWGTYGVPIVAKGRDEGGEGNALDLNYFMAIHFSGRLVADLEAEDSGANHPVLGTTFIGLGTWHHAAATYDGAVWRLYLDGRLESYAVADFVPRSDSLQHFSIGTALNSAGEAAGFFDGAIDEVRVWDHARSAAQIRAALNGEIESAPGLLGHWGMNESGGEVVYDSSLHGHHGTLVNAERTAGAPFNLDLCPDDPLLLAPAAGASLATFAATLRVSVSDPESDTVDVSFLGRPRPPPRPGAFALAVLPDTQMYANLQLDLDWIFEAQTLWIVEHAAQAGVAWVGHVGDIVQHDAIVEWDDADAAISILDTLPGLPYLLGVGNHDQTPGGNPDGTHNFNKYFPFTRYEGIAPWYGGHMGADNDNSFVLFSAGGMDYIAVTIEFNGAPEAIAWADGVIAAHPERRAIVVSHAILLSAPGAEPASITPEGLELWNALRDNPNLFLMLCGHVYGEGRRTEVYQGHAVHMLLANYQHRNNGGNGWMRLLELAPGDEAIRVRTYSPTLAAFESDADSDFWLGTPPGGPFMPLGSVCNVPGGGVAEILWPLLVDGQSYEWKVTVSDGASTSGGPVWSFDVDLGSADVNGDGTVNVSDLLVVILSWGPCDGGGEPCPGDLDGDGTVGVSDLVALIVSWG